MKKLVALIGATCIPLGGGASQAQVDSDFSAGGGIKIGTSTTTCGAGAEGVVRYNSVSKKTEFCDASSWKELTSAVPSTDSTPNAFTFTDVTNQSLNTSILSNTLNITGFDGALSATVTGGGTPEISINGGAWVTSGTITSGQNIAVRLNSSPSVSTELIATVTIGSTSDNWNVTSKAGQTRIFRTNLTYNGNMGGLSGADANCQNQAVALGYSGNWKAILSDSTTNASTRLTIAYPVVMANDEVTVVDSTNLWDASLDGVAIAGNTTRVWTGSTTSGTTSNSCSNWTSIATTGATGTGNSTLYTWISQWTGMPCSGSQALYCVDQ